jgi:hypothetical protein
MSAASRLFRWPPGICATMALIFAGPIARADDVSSYCAELKQVATAALARDKFAAIIGKPRAGPSHLALLGAAAALCGGLKIVYDLALLYSFRHVTRRKRRRKSFVLEARHRLSGMGLNLATEGFHEHQPHCKNTVCSNRTGAVRH